VAGTARGLVGPTSVLASCVSLQCAAALATTLFATFGAAGTGALRFAAGAIALLVFTRPRLTGRSRAGWLTIAALGAATATTNLCLYAAIARIPLALAGTLVFLGPLTLTLLSARRRGDLVWAIAAAGGVVLLSRPGVTASVAGVVFALAAAASVAITILLARRAGEQGGGLQTLSLAIVVAALLTLPLGVRAALEAPDAGAVATVAAVGILGIAIPYALEFSALRRVGVKTYGILLSLDPAVAALAGLLLLGQRLETAELLGIALVMAASAGVIAGDRG
jgi:inner membrane transporter RhtA